MCVLCMRSLRGQHAGLYTALAPLPCARSLVSDGTMHPPMRFCVVSAGYMSFASAHALCVCHKVVNRFVAGSLHRLFIWCIVSLQKGLPCHDCCVEVLIPWAPCFLCWQFLPEARGRMPPIHQNGEFSGCTRDFPSQLAVRDCLSVTSYFTASALRWALADRTRGFCIPWECLNNAGLCWIS